MEGRPSRATALADPLFVLCAIQFLLQLDLSIVNLALKTVQEGLDFSAAGLQWVNTAYALTFGSLLMLGGRLGDRVGRRRLIFIGLAVFGVASLACGLAGSPGVLVAGRFVQGAAAAMVAPTVLAMVTSIYPAGPARMRAIGVWSASVAVGGTTGVIAGGILAEAFGWRSIFLLNMLIVAVLLPLVRRVLPELPGHANRRLDPVGGASLTFATGALIYGVTSAEQHGFDSPHAWIPLALSALLLVVFLVNESRVPEPMVPLSFLSSRVRRSSALTMFLLGGLLAGYMYFIALSLQLVLGFSPLVAGLCLFPTGLAMFSSAMFLSHRLIGRLGIKPVLLIGITAHAVAMLVFSQVDEGTSFFTEVLPALLVNAAGMGLIFPAISLAITSDAGPDEMGIAAGLVPASQQVGGAVILALLATLAAAVTGSDGSLSDGYEVGFYAAFGIAALAGLTVATTSFRSVNAASAEPAATSERA